MRTHTRCLFFGDFLFFFLSFLFFFYFNLSFYALGCLLVSLFLTTLVLKRREAWRETQLEETPIHPPENLAIKNLYAHQAITTYCTFPQQNPNNNDECSICLEFLVEGGELATTPCGHHYHYECLYRWFLEKRTCPICKRSVESKMDG